MSSARCAITQKLSVTLNDGRCCCMGGSGWIRAPTYIKADLAPRVPRERRFVFEASIIKCKMSESAELSSVYYSFLDDEYPSRTDRPTLLQASSAGEARGQDCPWC